MKKLLLLIVALFIMLSLTACEVYFGDAGGGGASSSSDTSSPASSKTESSTATAQTSNQGDATFKLDKTKYAPEEAIRISVSGVTQTMVDNRAWIGIFREGASHDEYLGYVYVESGSSTAEINAIEESGSFELRLFKTDPPEATDFIMAVPFTVE